MPAIRVGRFQVRTYQRYGRWLVSIDGTDLPSWYMSEARAAGAGLVAAQRLLDTESDASDDDGEAAGAAA